MDDTGLWAFAVPGHGEGTVRAFSQKAAKAAVRRQLGVGRLPSGASVVRIEDPERHTRRAADLRVRLAQKALEDPEGIWSDLLEDQGHAAARGRRAALLRGLRADDALSAMRERWLRRQDAQLHAQFPEIPADRLALVWMGQQGMDYENYDDFRPSDATAAEIIRVYLRHRQAILGTRRR